MFKITGSIKKLEVVTAAKAKEIIKEAEELAKEEVKEVKKSKKSKKEDK